MESNIIDSSCSSGGCSCDSNQAVEHSQTRHKARIFLALLLMGAGLSGFPGQVVVFITAYILVGLPVLYAAWKNILRGRVFDEMFLMTIATLGAIAIGELAEAVAVMLFYSVGEYFQNAAVGRSRQSIRELMNLRPDTVRVLTENGAEILSPEAVMPDSIIEVLPGERIPLDSTVSEGTSSVDSSALTGESRPQHVHKGDSVLAGFMNNTGRLRLQVDKPFRESSVARILQLVENASASKAPTERFITRFAKIYTPIVVLTAAAVALIPPLLLPDATFSEWIYRALVVLVVSCPCALVVSIPLGYFAGIGGAARRGILVKGAHYLDGLNTVATIVFDKTGTLTKGVFQVQSVNPRNGFSREDVLRWAAYAENHSTHPIAVSIAAAFPDSINGSLIESVSERRGYGISAAIDGTQVLVGNDRLMHLEEIPHSDCDAAGTVVYVAVDGRYAGYIAIADEIKPEAHAAVADLKKHGIARIVMLTGDNQGIAESIAAQLDIPEVYAELLPEDKVALVERMQAETADDGKLVFIGDGINDAPVLMRADIGIAMGGIGSDAAIEAADVVLMDDSLLGVPAALQAGQKTSRIIRQNIAFTLTAKAVFIALGAVGIASMWMAVLGDVGVALLAVLSSLRALRPAAAAE